MVDCGAAPGAWSQVAVQRVNSGVTGERTGEITQVCGRGADMIVTTFNLEFVLLLRLYVRDDFEPNLTIFCPIFPYCVAVL